MLEIMIGYSLYFSLFLFFFSLFLLLFLFIFHKWGSLAPFLRRPITIKFKPYQESGLRVEEAGTKTYIGDVVCM